MGDVEGWWSSIGGGTIGVPQSQCITGPDTAGIGTSETEYATTSILVECCTASVRPHRAGSEPEGRVENPKVTSPILRSPKPLVNTTLGGIFSGLNENGLSPQIPARS